MIKKETREIIDYNYDKQKLFLRYLISSETAFVRCQNILNPMYWTDKLRPVARYIINFAQQYNKLPSSDLIHAETGVIIDVVDASESFSDWFLDEIEEFCRHKAMEALIYEGPSLLEKGEYAELERRSRDNMMITLQKDLGTDYFADPLARLQKMKDRTGMTSTGWSDIDSKLYGGFNRGELSFFVGGPGCVTGDTYVTVIKLVDIDEDAFPYAIVRMGSNQASDKIEYLTNYYTLDQIKKYSKRLPDNLAVMYAKSQPYDVRIDSLNDFHDGQKYLVDSPDGWVSVVDFVRKPPKTIYEITLVNDLKIKASEDHLFQHKNNNWIYTRDLQLGDILITRLGISPVKTIVKLSEKQEVFDLSIDHENHRYYTAGICSHNTGKSLFLQNIALNWIEMGLNVVYITLELSEELVGLRFDAMITQRPTKFIFGNMDDTALKLNTIYKSGKDGIKYGKLQIKGLPGAGTTANDIRAYLKEYEIQSGVKPDALVVDYLDLLHTNSGKINVSDLFIKDKYTSEELRALAVEWNILAVSAAQLNRGSIQETNFDASHIAGGISKINTADNVMAIFTSASMREEGEYQIQFMKTRSASGVGSKVLLRFNIENLRITNSEKSQTSQSSGGISKLQSQLLAKKPTTKLSSDENSTMLPIDEKAIKTRDRIRNLAAHINKD